ncbi:TolC family protein [Chitinophaga vietnamensis]|uniref:TolC family protein n=1 Tax=Chitinophaga vietnamensis TaxID=2593957 RepID=UPI001177C8B3|nr:TolC family protein [Chitinophaga vietnamensis]
MELCSFITINMSTLSCKLLTAALLLLFACNRKAYSQDPATHYLTLPEVWKKAAEHNKQLQMKYLHVQSMDARIKNAKAEKLPEVKADGMYGRVSNLPIYEDGLLHAPAQYPVVHETYKFGADAYWNVYNGGKTNREISMAQTEHALAQEQQHLSEQEIRYKVAAYYLDIYRNRMYEKVMLRDIADREQELNEIRQLQKNGVVLKSDVLRAELKLSKQKMTLLEIRNSIVIAVQRLNILTGDPDTTPVNIAMDTLALAASPERTYEDYLNDAYEHSFTMKISEKETALSELKLKQVKANVLPRVGLFAEYGYAYPQILFYPYSVALYGLGQTGVKASLPISAFYLNKHKKEEAALHLRQQEIEHADTRDQVREAVKAAYVRYTEALTRIQVANDNIAQAQENFRIVNNTYFNQLSLLTDLLDAETQLLQSRFDLTTAQVTAQLQYYQLLKATGNL